MDLFGKYELTAPLGHGGMAEVFKARHVSATGVAKQVVVKRILPGMSKHAEFRSMFFDEGRLTTQLSHGNVVQVFEAGEIDGQLFLAMEWVDGVSLDKVLQRAQARGVRLPPVVAVLIAIEALKGLHHAHTRLGEDGRLLRIVHRDISPDNLLVSFEGQVKVSDFGIAKAALEGRAETSSGVFKGKLMYGAPEQIRGEKVDARADVFSLGVVLYEMLTGGNPIGTRAVELAMTGAALPRLGTFFLGDELPDVVARAIASKPDERYPSALAFQQALTAWMLPRAGAHAATGISSLMAWLFPIEASARGLPVELDADTRGWLESNPAVQPGFEPATAQPLDPTALSGTPVPKRAPTVLEDGVAGPSPAPPAPPATPTPARPGHALRNAAVVAATAVALGGAVLLALRAAEASDDRAAISSARQSFERRQLANAHATLTPLLTRAHPPPEAVALDAELARETDASLALTEGWKILDVAASKHRPFDAQAFDAVLARARGTRHFTAELAQLETASRAPSTVTPDALDRAIATSIARDFAGMRAAIPCPASAGVCSDDWYLVEVDLEHRTRDALDRADALVASQHLHEARQVLEVMESSIFQRARLERLGAQLAVTSSEEQLEQLIREAITRGDWKSVDQVLNECASGVRTCANASTIAERAAADREFSTNAERAEAALAAGHGDRAGDYLNYGGQPFYQRARLEADSKAVRDWLTRHPSSKPCSEPGRAALAKKNYDGAVATLQRCTRGDDKDYDSWRLLGDALRLSRLGDKEASAAYQRYLELAPSREPSRDAVTAALQLLWPFNRGENNGRPNMGLTDPSSSK